MAASVNRKGACFFGNTMIKLARKSIRCLSSQVPQSVQSIEVLDKQERKVINPLEHEDFFGIKKIVKLKELFDNRVYFGHKAGSRNPYMAPFVFGNRLGVDVIDLDQTLPLFQDALNVAAHISFRKGVILFVSRNRQMMPFIERAAMDCGEYSHCRYWSGGSFTNATAQFGAETRLPDLCIFINTLNSSFEQHSAVVSAAKLNIPCTGIVDTNCDPRLITYPIPGNDDTPIAINYYLRLFKEAILKGKGKRKELEEQGYNFDEVEEDTSTEL